MYKSDRQRIESVIFSALFLELMLTHCIKGNTPEAFNYTYTLLTPGIEEALDRNRLSNRLTELRELILGYFYRNKFSTRKCFMTLSFMAATLHDSGVRTWEEGLQTFVRDMDKSYAKARTDIQIRNADNSAIRHSNKVLSVFHKEGYFEDIEKLEFELK